MTDPFKKYKGNPNFYKLLVSVAKLHEKKAHDYGSLDDPLSNFRLSELCGLRPWQGVVIRLSDKFSRLCGFVNKGKLEVDDENIIDTFTDMAIYALLGAVLYKEDKDAVQKK